MTRYTEAQRDVYLAWVDEQINVPDRHDFYIMDLTCSVDRKFAQNPAQIQPRKLKFKTRREQMQEHYADSEVKRIHRENVTALAKAQAVARMGGEAKVVKTTKRPEWAVKDEPIEDFWPDFLPKQ